MGVLIHHHDRFDPLARTTVKLDRPTTVRRLVQKHRALRPHTTVYRPGGLYGRRNVREFRHNTIALLNARPLLRRDWRRTVVGPGDVLSFVTVPPQPRGGGGGGGGSNPLGIVLMLAVMVATAWLGPEVGLLLGFAEGSLLGNAIGGAIVSLTLGAVAYGVMSLFASPAPPSMVGQTGFAGTPASSPTYNLQAQGNVARLQQPIPEAFGRNRMFPDFVTTPYVQYVGNDQFLHHILGLGIGEFEIEADSVKLGDTPIGSYPDIDWAVVAPGDLVDLAIADERFITATDLADVELPDAGAGSTWMGPFAANPPGTTVDRMEVDTGAPRGLFAFNSGTGGLDALTATFEVQAQAIDDSGTPTGSWEAFSPTTITKSPAASQDPQRWTDELIFSGAGRWQVRVRRTDTKNTSAQAGHQLDWIGLRGRLIGRRRFAGMTCIAVKMQAGAALNSSQARQFNLVATRKLATWDDGAQAMGTALAATRSPCDAFAAIALSSNGGRLREAQLDLAGLYANLADFDDAGWTFDFVFDSGVTVSEALARVSRAVVAERVTQGGKLRLVRDVPAVAPVAMFSPRNIRAGSLDLAYAMVDSTTADALVGTYIDQVRWKPIDVTVAFDDSRQDRPSRMPLYGVGSRDQARAVLWNLARANRYRRRTATFSTAMEGLAVLFGDGISLSHDVPRWGQTLEVTAFDADSNTFTLVDPPDFSASATYYAAVRDSSGLKAGPFVAAAVPGQANQLALTVPDPDDLPEILTGRDAERTWLQLGPGEAYARPMKVKQVTPRDETTAEIVCFDDDPRMYADLPDDPEPAIGGEAVGSRPSAVTL